MKNRLLLLDRDGTLILEPPDEQIDSLEKLEFYPGVIRYLGNICNELQYHLIMVSNQDGLGTLAYPEECFRAVQHKMITTFANEGIVFEDILIDRSTAAHPAPTRKPGTGLLKHYLNGRYDLEHSFVIGDRLTDVILAKNLGAKAIWLAGPENRLDPALDPFCLLQTQSWQDIYQYLKSLDRVVKLHRKTSETTISVSLNLDGEGQADIQTGIGFFDHMLAQLAKHSGCDITLSADGDLHIDEHHTIEDSALLLGAAFHEALRNKTGIGRYGFFLPMDDAIVKVAIDFGGRPWLNWDVVLQREMVGDMPTEMVKHFFKSFSDTACCNLYIEATGQNDHHKIEAIFKAVARAIRMAVRRDGTTGLPSTKGLL